MNDNTSHAQPRSEGLQAQSSSCPPPVPKAQPCALPITQGPVWQPDDIDRQAVVLNWLGQQEVVFHRIYVDIVGGVLPALWLSHVLSHLLITLQSTPDAVDHAEYVFVVDSELCEAATGLTTAEQLRCIVSMTELGLVAPDHSCSPRTCRLRLQRLADLTIAHSAPLASALRQAAGHAPDLALLEARSSARRARLRRKAA